MMIKMRVSVSPLSCLLGRISSIFVIYFLITIDKFNIFSFSKKKKVTKVENKFAILSSSVFSFRQDGGKIFSIVDRIFNLL